MGNLIDLTGLKFGKWTVLGRDTSVHKKNIYWKCICECGTVRSVAGTSLRSGISVSCGCERDEKTSKRTEARVEDLTGKRFGMWTVLQRDPLISTTSKRGARWICKCDCGKIKSVLGYSLKNGSSVSCGCENGKTKIIDLTGQRFGKLTVLSKDENNHNTKKGIVWKCRCDCGKIVSVSSGNLRSGITRSCGCLKHNNEKVGTQNLEGKQFNYWKVIARDTTIKNQGPFYLCECICGKRKTISGYNFVKGLSKSCGCQKGKPREDLTGKRFGKLVVLGKDEDRVGKGIFWKCRCDCGNIKSYKANILKNGKAVSCGCESRKKSAKRLFVDLTRRRFGKLEVIGVDHRTIDNNGNSEYYWKCKCDCGNETIVRGTSLTNGDTLSCGCLQAAESAKRAKQRIIDITGKRFGLLTVIERVELDESGNGLGTWKCKCDCGNIKYAEGYYLRKGMISSCGCLSQSKLELYVIQYFNEKNYQSPEDYQYQARFDELRNNEKRMLSYDFALYDEGKLNWLIECQGQQHYKPVEIFGGEQQFKKQKVHDELKKQYANKIGAKLIEIPYTAETYEDVKEILEKKGI